MTPSVLVTTSTDVDATVDESALTVVKRGWGIVPELRQRWGVTVGLAIAGSLSRLVVPVVLQQAIDHGLQDSEVKLSVVVRLAAVGAIVLVATALCLRAALLRLASQSEAALCGLRSRVFAHLQELSLEEHASQHRGALVARVASDIETLSQFFSWSGVAWLVDVSLLVTVTVAMAIYDWRLALVALLASAPLWFVMRVLQRHLVDAYSRVRVYVGEYLASVSEVVSGAATVRAYNLTPATTERVHAANMLRRDASIRSVTIAALLFPATEVFSVLTVSAVVAVGLWLGPAGGLTVGSLVSFVFLTNRFLEPVVEFGEIMNETQTAVAGLKRVLDVLDLPVELTNPTDGTVLPPGPPTIELDHLTFHYRARTRHDGQVAVAGAAALDDVSLLIAAGSSVAVVGHTGSGKSTLAKIVARLADPTAGAVRFDGHDLRVVSKASLRATVLLVPQEPFMFDDTIAHNIRFARPSAVEGEVEQAVAELGLVDWVESLPLGLETHVGERGDSLSAGERQLVALIRAQLAQRPCLVLDEATSSVDPGTEARVARAVERLARGRTTITIAHRLSTAVRADRILVFERGRLVQDGKHADLVRLEGPYAQLHHHWITSTTSARG